MRRLVMVAVVIALVLPSGVGVRAQDGGDLQCTDEDIAGAIDQAVADLQAAGELAGTAALEEIAHIQARLATLDYGCRHIAEAAGTPSDPLPIGEYYEFEGGLVRVVSFGLAPEGVGRATDGYRVWVAEMEYICQLADPNETCTGTDFSAINVVTPDGVVLDTEFVGGVAHTWMNVEAFAGNTLQGEAYFQLSADQSIGMLEMFDMLNFDSVYVNVVAEE